MVSDREKLIKLLGGDMCKDVCCYDCEYEDNDKGCIEHIKQNMADHLLANGVTFQKWIPVSERLPEEEELVLIICKNGARFVGYYKRLSYKDEICWGIKTALNSTRWLNKGRVTHWMPLPTPPQEV